MSNMHESYRHLLMQAPSHTAAGDSKLEILYREHHEALDLELFEAAKRGDTEMIATLVHLGARVDPKYGYALSVMPGISMTNIPKRDIGYSYSI